MDISRRGQILDTSHLLERIEVDGKDDMGVVHHYPPFVVIYAHGLSNIAEFHTVCTEEHLVLNLIRCRIIIGKRRIAILEVTLVGNEKSEPVALKSSTTSP